MFHNQHESRGVHLSDYIESESDSGMKRFSLQDGQMSNCMLSARFLWYKAIIIKPFLFFPEKSVGYFIAEQNIFLIIARQYIIKHLIYNGLPESIIRGYPCLTTKVPINTHPLPYCLKKGRIFLWSDGTGERSLRPNIVGFLFPPITV